MYIIYKCENNLNGKIYIGQTKRSLEERKNQHINDALSKRSNVEFHKALRKYGIDNFTWDIVQYVKEDSDALNNAEIQWIQYFDSYNNGYNMTCGGSHGYSFSLSEEAKDKIRKARTGTKTPDLVRTKLSNAHKGVKLSESHVRANAVGHQKKVRCVELDLIFDSIKEAGKYCIDNNLTKNKTANSTISSCLKGRQNTAYGYHWEYYTQEQQEMAV